MLYPYIPLTAEDSAIWERFPWRYRVAYHLADQRDARIMLDLGRAVHDACGLSVRVWIMASLQSEQEAIRVEEFTEADFEHVTLDGRYEFDGIRLDLCPHGVDMDMLADHPAACAECYSVAVEAEEHRSQCMIEEAIAAGSW